MKKNRLKLIGRILVAVITMLSLYVSIEVIVASNQNRPPQLFGVSISYVPTNSMEDTIMPGDYVMFSKITYDKVSVGDIIVYRSNQGEMNNKFIIHRVIEQHDGYLITKGDHNPTADTEHITPDMVMGKFICVIGFMNAFSSFNRSAILTLLIIIFVVMIILQGTSIVLKYQKDKLEKNKQDSIDLEQLKKEILEEELAKLKKKE